MANFLIIWSESIWYMLVDSAAWFLVGLVLAGLAKAFFDDERVGRFLGRTPRQTVVRAALVGVPLPLCSCSVLPVAMQLRQSGVSRGGTVSFLVSTPESGIDSILLTYSLMDPMMTVARPLSAFLSAIAAGTVEDVFGSNGCPGAAVDDDRQCTSGCGCAAEGSDHLGVGWWRRAGHGLHHAFTDMMSELSPYLFVGYALAGLVAVLVGPQAGQLPEILRQGWLAYVGALLVGIPLYICATSSTPLAAVLLASGFPPGAVLVFLLAGPATNVTSLTVLRKILGVAATLRFVSSIIVMSVLCGLILDALYAGLSIAPRYRIAAESDAGVSPLFVVCAALLGALIVGYSVRAVVTRLRGAVRP